MVLPQIFFKSSRGLRQGDPLSPYLFVIAMEALNVCWWEHKRGGFLSGVKVGERAGEGEEISRLLFVDDTIAFCGVSLDHITNLYWLLMWFEVILRVKISLERREMISVGSVDNVDSLAWKINCKVGELLSSYLGLPLEASYKSKAIWDKDEEQFHKRLSLWKRHYISKGGQITLIYSTPSSLPIYFISLFTILSAMRLRLEKSQRDFLEGGGALANKPHLVKWSSICKAKENGGLIILSLCWIRLSFANDVGITQVKRKLFGRRSSRRSMRRKKGVAIL